MQKIFLLLALILAGCAAPPYYMVDQDRANARLKPRVVPTEQTNTWKTYDQIVDQFPKSLNIPHYKDLAGRVLQPPRVLAEGEPVIPQELVEAHQEGHVLVVAVVSTEGKVVDARIGTSTNRLLNGPALACVRRWRLSPATIDGTPISYVVPIPIEFRVRRKS
jgi:TonB family protein